MRARRCWSTQGRAESGTSLCSSQRFLGAEVFATVSAGKQHVVEEFGATTIDYRTLSTEQYVAIHTKGQGFDVVYDTVGGATIDASFVAVKRYTGHVVSCLGWSTHSLAPLSFRGATYSGVFTLMPLLTGLGQAHHGVILREAAALVDGGKLRPLLNNLRFSSADIDVAHGVGGVRGSRQSGRRSLD